MEREKFEKSLKNAFEGAEVGPSDKVWTNIELGLEKAKGGDLKKRLLFYQMLAAASVVFAMAIGGVGFYNTIKDKQIKDQLAMETHPRSEASRSPSDQKAGEENINKSAGQTQSATGEQTPSAIDREGSESTAIKEEPSTADIEISKDQAIESQRAVSEATNQQQEFSGTPKKSDSNNSFRNSDPAPDAPQNIPPSIAINGNEAQFQELPLVLSDRDLPPLYTPGEVRLDLQPQKEVMDPVVAMLAKLEQREREVQGEKENKKGKEIEDENLWTSIGFAAGSFNSMQSSVSSPAPAMSTARALTAPIVEKETKASGYSYSMGVNVGTKISERWVLQGGVNYLTHASEYTANNVVASSSNYQQQRFRAISTNEVMNSDAQDLNSKIVYSAPYNVNNSMRYLSIPMQAGYLLVNKTFGLQLNAGVATDLFLQNTISADSDQLDKTSQPGGTDSPYRTLNLSGLFGTEVSYRFGPHYRVSLNPGIRYPFNTIYKSELGVQSTPLTFDVGLRFRYIFR